MADGGNAVDAAVAMAFAACVCEPTEASIGGSGFMLVHDAPTGRSFSIEFPPRAPARARVDMYELAGDANATGFLAPCVPGVVAGLCLVLTRFGTLPLEVIMEPAIELAEAGFEVDEYLALQTLDNIEALRANPEAARIFLRDGLPPVPRFAVRPASSERPLLRQPDLGATLRAVAAGGAEAFYRGDLATSIAASFETHGGLVSRTDLGSYRAVVEEPLRGTYRGWSILAPRSPNGGWTVLQALRILEHFDLPALDRSSDVRLHLVAEALLLAFADRYRYAGDTEAQEALLSEARVRKLARTIDAEASNPGVRSLAAAPRAGVADAGHGTTHLNSVDADGRMVSCTVTLGNTFGSKVVADGTGVLFDSGMAWFDARPGAPNSIAPGKRPLVNMAPLLVLRDGGPGLAVGAAGGRRIISAVTQVVSHVLDHGLALQEAICAPRLDASERTLRVSDRLPAEGVDGLSARGHQVVSVREEHAPFSYELARPAAAGIDEAGIRSGGIHPFATGYVGGC